ncbi:Interleukin-2 receptor subunit alpha [Manis javanica]|nr:Interleukin-2 receptor subunit alpha [Manis javanica]
MTGPTGATGTTDFQKHTEVATTTETFIFAVKYQIAGLTHGSLTEAWPLSLSEEHACQFIPQRQPVP